VLSCLDEQRRHGRQVTGWPKVASARGRTENCEGRAKVVVERLANEYPGTADDLCALRHRNAFELLAATILSAQCTDARVNMVTPALFAAYPDPAALARADPEALEEIIRSTGFFRSKAKNLTGMAQGIEERFGGEVPSALEDLVTLPGVVARRPMSCAASPSLSRACPSTPTCCA